MDVFEFARILGELFFGEDAEGIGRLWLGHSKEERREFFQRIRREGFMAFCARRLVKSRVLSKEDVARLRDENEGYMRKNMLDEVALKQLYDEFEAGGIRFCPIKGIDLAYRVYPVASLRRYDDWDILFHPDDFKRALDFLRGRGWLELRHGDVETDHHSSPMKKDDFILEPHRTLACFPGTDPRKIWKYVFPVSAGGCRHVLSPEMNILQMARHASEFKYREIAVSKLLLDAGMLLMAEDVDWGRVREISVELGQPYAGDLFGAFPEFFPAEIVAQMAPDPDRVSAYREIFLRRGEFLMVGDAELMMESENRFSKGWFRCVFGVFHPKNIRHAYNLPEKGDWRGLLKGYWTEVCQKFKRFFRYAHHKTPGLREYLATIRRAER